MNSQKRRNIISTAFRYRVAAIDLDDTLLGPDKQISPANEEALRRLQAHGVRVVLASGRRHENMLRFHRQLGLEGPIISCQGALVRHAETNEIWHRHLMDSADADDVLRLGIEWDVTQMYYHVDDTFTAKPTPHTEIYESRTASLTTKIGDMNTLLGGNPMKIIWVCDAADVSRLLPEMRERYAGRVEILITDPEYLEFMSEGVSKAAGLAAVAAHYGIAQEETLAFGDGNNDVPMLRWAGMGIAMDHARPSAIEAADRTAPAGAPETSFARAVASLFS